MKHLNGSIIFKLMLIRYKIIIRVSFSLGMYYVFQVVDIMKDNLEKVLERDANLTAVESRAGKLD